MSENKKPILAIVIAVLLLIPTPFIILGSVGFFKNPLQKIEAFNMIPNLTSKILSQTQKAHDIKVGNFMQVFSDNLKTEYSEKMDDPNSGMRKMETYKAAFQLVIAIATIFICIGLMRIRKWAHKFIIIRLLATLLVIVPLTHLSAKHMNEVVISSLDKSLYELPELGGDEKNIEILHAIIQNKTKKQSRMPLIFGIIWNGLLLGYFLHPQVKKTYNIELKAQQNA